MSRVLLKATEEDELSYDELINWLRLIRTENVGPVTFFDLMSCYSCSEDAIDALPSLARRGGKKDITVTSTEEVMREIDALTKLGGQFVTYGSKYYPKYLASIYDAPPVLAVLGDPALLTATTQMMAIVGSRNASINGKKLTTQMSKALSEKKWVVVSGMARGIDTEAHYGALHGGTIAVLGTGVDVPYPRENEVIYNAIIEKRGCIVSELPMGTQPLAINFPRRNRIIAGLSMGTIVTEATLHSGSLITAKYALEYGRDIFAVPGSPFDPRCHGTNDLIRQGAVLTESIRDVFEIYDCRLHYPVAESSKDVLWGTENVEIAANDDYAGKRDEVLNALNAAPTPVEEIMEEVKITPAYTTRILLELELAGKIQRLPGGKVAKL